MFGRSQADFWRDVPDAPAQAVKTRLQLQLGEWFLDRNEGTPYRTRVLGKFTRNTRDPVLRARILGTRGVTELATYSSQTDSNLRTFNVQATINTLFGTTRIVEPL